jgi:hypothetical protein
MFKVPCRPICRLSSSQIPQMVYSQYFFVVFLSLWLSSSLVLLFSLSLSLSLSVCLACVTDRRPTFCLIHSSTHLLSLSLSLSLSLPLSLSLSLARLLRLLIIYLSLLSALFFFLFCVVTFFWLSIDGGVCACGSSHCRREKKGCCE